MLSNFYQRLQEKGFFKKVAIFAASAWGIIEVVDYFVHRYQWPEAIVDVSVVLLVAAIPFLVIRMLFQSLGAYRWLEIFLLSVNVIFAAFLTYHFITKSPKSPPLAIVDNPSILVVPFKLASDSVHDAYFADGVTSAIITELTKISQLSVLSEAISFDYKSKKIDLPALSAAGINYVLQGKVQRSGKQILVTSELINVANGFQVWADQFQRDATDIFKMQDQISASIVTALKVKLTNHETERLGSKITNSLEAYDLYLKGRYRMNSVRKEDLDSAILYLNKAISLDNNFARAHAELSIAYSKRNHFITDMKENYTEKAYVEGEKALSLDSTLAEVYYARAYDSWTPQNKFPHDQVILDLKKALKINPKYDDALNLLAKVYLHVGLLDEGYDALQKASKTNPLNGYVLADISSYYFFKGDYPKMLEAFAKVPRGYSEDSYWATEHIIALMNVGRTVEAAKLLAEGLKKNRRVCYIRLPMHYTKPGLATRNWQENIWMSWKNYPTRKIKPLHFITLLILWARRMR